MKLKSMQALAATALLFAANWAQAAGASTISCGIAQPSPGFSSAYVPANPGINITQTSFTVTCQRNSAGDPTTVNYSVDGGNGLNPTGQQNRAAFGANRILYDLYKDGGCATDWRGGGGAFTGLSMALGAVGVPTSVQTTYWGCIPAGQLGLPAGTYTDTVIMTLASPGNNIVGAPFTFAVSIFTPSVCNITSAPGNIVFAYTAFGGAQAVSTTFGATCTSLLPYTMALDATSGVVSGLQYLLALSAASSTGSGFEQTHSINGTMPAGQAGTCATGSCSATNIHTLTITY